MHLSAGVYPISNSFSMLLFVPGSLDSTNKKHFSKRDDAERYPRQNEQLKCNAVSTKSHIDREIDKIHMLMNGSR